MYAAFLPRASSGVSPGSKLTVTMSNSLPTEKFSTPMALTRPLRTCVHSIGHS